MNIHKITEDKYLVTDGDIVEIVDKQKADAMMVEKKDSEKKDDKKSGKYFFNTVLFFTNDRDPESNKTLKNLEDAIKGQDIELVIFVADEVSYKATDKKITISDSKTKFVIDNQSNVDTIVIARLGVQDSEECMACVKELQEWGLYVLNPVQAAEKASNKYESAVLLERHGIPQPRFVLIEKNDLKDGMKSLSKKLKNIYDDAGDDDGTEKREYVVKILDGHGGTGVFMSDEKEILAILQFAFAVDEELQLLVQRKEDGDGGDIRVHVITTRTGQKIIASMKRVKISKDFRSNVSLGATAETVELTEEQEKIAKDVAAVSGMPWTAVDIMPLKKKNVDGYSNVVLEYNASPGSDGISAVIKKNFCKVLLDAINDINELVLQPKSIGYRENITIVFDEKNSLELEVKLDTGNGAYSSTIGCDKIDVNGDDITATIKGKTMHFKKHGVSKPKVGQVREERTTVIIPRIKIGSRQLLDVEFALVDNRDKSTDVLLNRDVMSKMAYNINPAKRHLLD